MFCALLCRLYTGMSADALHVPTGCVIGAPPAVLVHSYDLRYAADAGARQDNIALQWICTACLCAQCAGSNIWQCANAHVYLAATPKLNTSGSG